jgi:hypothetical protein
MDASSRNAELEDGVLIVLAVDSGYVLILSHNHGRICLLLFEDLKIRHRRVFQ